MEVLTNCVITKVYEGANGEKEGRPWQIYNFYVKDRKERFSIFGSEKFIPVEGMNLKLLKYEITQSGEYTNYNVKEVIVADEKESTQSELGQPEPKKEVDWDAIAFKKCKYGFLQQVFLPWIKGELSSSVLNLTELEEVAEEFATMCMRISLDYTTATQEPKQEKDIVSHAPEPNVGANEPSGDDIPPIEAYEDGK